jgi:NitT/TauT family transport system permease protein
MNYSSETKSGLRAYLTRSDPLRIGLMVSSLPLFIAGWWLLSIYLQGQNFYYLPTPLEVWNALVASWEWDPVTHQPLLANINASLGRFALGFVIAIVIAVPLGLLIGYSYLIDAFSKPIIEVLRPVPPIAWVPFLLLSLGLFWGPVITIFIGVFFPVLSNVIFGVRSVDPLLIDVAKTQGASNRQVFTKVIFPFSIPFIMAGLKIGVGIGWMCIVAAELFAAQGGGIGVLITAGQTIGRYDIMFAGMVVVGLLGIVTLTVSEYLEKRVKIWMGMM